MDNYDSVYRDEKYYWGKKPNDFCHKVIQTIPSTAIEGTRLIDLGTGEGKDMIYFASKGMEVTGVDISAPGLEKAQRWADVEGLTVQTVEADLNDFRIGEMYDVVYSSGTLTYLKEENRKEAFLNYQAQTATDGINAFNAFVLKPGIGTPPDWGREEHFFKPGELASYYANWETVISSDEVFECHSSGISHMHAMETVIARKA